MAGPSGRLASHTRGVTLCEQAPPREAELRRRLRVVTISQQMKRGGEMFTGDVVEFIKKGNEGVSICTYAAHGPQLSALTGCGDRCRGEGTTRLF